MRYAIITEPVEAVLDEAKKYLGIKEIPPSSNRGLTIDYWLNECKVPLALPWCAAFVTNIIRQALGRGSPVYLNASVQRIVDWAKTLVSIGVWQDKPEVGDLFVIYFPSMERFGHVGFVKMVSGDGKSFETIEGNSNSDGSRDGYGVVTNTRRVTDSIKFIRWKNALPDK